MTDTEHDHAVIPGNDALASLPEAAQPRPVDVADPLNDPTIILQGSQVLGRAAWSAGRMAVADGTIALYMKAKAEKDAREADEARQLERLSAWNQEKTTLCGVEMTNGEAQEARQRVIDNDEAYANWAVKTGRIRDDEKDDFKAAIRRKKELEDKRGRGTLTPAEAAEADQLSRSRVGQAADAATAEDFSRNHRSLDARAQMSDGDQALRRGAASSGTPPSYGDQTPFQALQNAIPAPTKASPVAERVKATGLDL